MTRSADAAGDDFVVSVQVFVNVGMLVFEHIKWELQEFPVGVQPAQLAVLGEADRKRRDIIGGRNLIGKDLHDVNASDTGVLLGTEDEMRPIVSFYEMQCAEAENESVLFVELKRSQIIRKRMQGKSPLLADSPDLPDGMLGQVKRIHAAETLSGEINRVLRLSTARFQYVPLLVKQRFEF